MAKKALYYTLLLCLCSLTGLAFSSCGGDDENETPENESPTTESSISNEMIGEWIISSAQHTHGYGQALDVFSKWQTQTKLSFYANNTYTDSSDGGSKRHSWSIEEGNGRSAYWYLYLDNVRLQLKKSSTTGAHKWDAKVSYPADEDKGDDDDTWEWTWHKWDNPNPDTPETPNTPEPTPKEYGLRISKIVETIDYMQGGNYDTEVKRDEVIIRYQTGNKFTYLFGYNSGTQLRSFEAPWGKYSYEYSNGQVALYADGKYYATCNVNSKGIATETTVHDDRGSHYISYSYDSSDRLTYIDCSNYMNSLGDDASSYRFYYDNDVSFRVDAVYATAIQNWVYKCSNEKNDMNIELNSFITYIIHSSMFYDSNFGRLFDCMAVAGLHGRISNLVGAEVPGHADFYTDRFQFTRDSDGLITQIIYYMINKQGGETRQRRQLDISYEQYEK